MKRISLLQRLARLLASHERSDRGATAVEYALISAGIAVALVVVVTLVGSSVAEGMTTAAGGLAGSPSVVAAGGQNAATPNAATPNAAAQQQAAAQQAAAQQAAAQTRSCPGTGVDPKDQDKIAPTCNTQTGTWTCPTRWVLESSGNPKAYYCKKD